MEVQQWKNEYKKLETIIVEKDKLLENLQAVITSGSLPIDAQKKTYVNTSQNEREIKVEYMEADDPLDGTKESSIDTDIQIMNKNANAFKDEFTNNDMLKRKYRINWIEHKMPLDLNFKHKFFLF